MDDPRRQRDFVPPFAHRSCSVSILMVIQYRPRHIGLQRKQVDILFPHAAVLAKVHPFDIRDPILIIEVESLVLSLLQILRQRAVMKYRAPYQI